MNQTIRNIVIGAAAVIIIIIACVFWAGSAASAYDSDIATFKQQLAGAHAAQRQDFNSVAADATNADVAPLIQQSENRFKDILDKAPSSQPILWLPFLAQDAKNQAHELRSAGEQLETALRNLRQYITYEGGVSAVIRDVASQEYVTLAGQEALAAKWSAGTQKLESLTVPSGAEQALNPFVEQFKKMQPTINAMVEATKHNDFAGYAQRRDEFVAQLGGLQKAAREFTNMARTYDNAVTDAYNKLGELTK